MAERLSRKTLYDLVWAEPMKKVAIRFGISDVALKKTCTRAAIPTPDRGYWAKKEAGKATVRAELPIRPPGMEDEVSIAGGGSSYGYWNDEELLGPIGPPPEFGESIEAVKARISEFVGHITVPRTVRSWHPAIERLLQEDEKRRQKQAAEHYSFSWNNPLFETLFERRRLRILNTLFMAVRKMNGNSFINRDGREIRISFFQQYLHLSLERLRNHRRRELPPKATTKSEDMQLCLAMLSGCNSESALMSWQDDVAQKLETRMTEIVIEVILASEIHYRDGALRRHQLRVQRKAELEEQARRRKLAAERAEIERQRRIEQARIDRLLKDAAAFQQAEAIREYVEDVRIASTRDDSSTNGELEQWSRWALAQADRIDPAISGRFLNAMEDQDDGK